MASDVYSKLLSAAVVDNGTITFAYDAGKDADFYSATGHSLYASALQASFPIADAGISVAFGETIVVTYKGSTTIPANSRVSFDAVLKAFEPVEGDLEITNLNVAEDLTVEGDAEITGDVDVTGDVTLGGTVAQTYESDAVANIEPMVVETVISGAGATGGRAKFDLTIDGAAGGWSNALKGIVNYGASGKTAGLGSAVCAEMVASEGMVDGSYAPLEIELGMDETAVAGTRMSFMSINAYGHATGLGKLDDNGFFFDLNGVAIGDAHMVAANQGAGAVDATHALRVQILGVTYYIPLHTANTFGNT